MLILQRSIKKPIKTRDENEAPQTCWISSRMTVELKCACALLALDRLLQEEPVGDAKALCESRTLPFQSAADESELPGRER